MQLQPDHAQRSDSKLYTSALARVDWPLTALHGTLLACSERSECANHEEHPMCHKDLVAPAIAVQVHAAQPWP